MYEEKILVIKRPRLCLIWFIDLVREKKRISTKIPLFGYQKIVRKIGEEANIVVNKYKF